MHKRTFHGLKRTFMHVSGLLPTYFDLKKSNYFIIWLFLNQNTMGEDQRHTETCVLGPETHVYACPRSSPPCFDKKPNALLIGFLSKYDGGNLSHA